MTVLFSKTRVLISNIDIFFDMAARSGMSFKEGIRLFVNRNIEEFDEVVVAVTNTEHEADKLRRDIEARLYSQALIPESRGDILGILESMGAIFNGIKKTMLNLSIEKPEIDPALINDFIDLSEPVTECVKALVSAGRAYFTNIPEVKTHLNEVRFFENESDRKTEKISRKLYSLDIHLSCKNQLKYFINRIDAIADTAEEVSNRIAIAAIKRVV